MGKKRSRASEGDDFEREALAVAQEMPRPLLEADAFRDALGRNIRVAEVTRGVSLTLTIMDCADELEGKRQAITVAWLLHNCSDIIAEILEHADHCEGDVHILDAAE